MEYTKFLRYCFSILVVALCSQAVSGQVLISGTVYDQSQRFAMVGVSVIGVSGTGTTTDSTGSYRIRLFSGDSLYFSYLGRATARFAVKDIPPGYPFNMSLDVAIDSLATVFVQSRNYLADSLANRKEYEKVFEYGTHYIDKVGTRGRGAGMGVGIDFDMLLNGKKNRQMMALQRRLEEEEKDKYVDHRFNRALVRRITGLEAPALDTFMKEYRPSKEFIQTCETDYEFYHYIQEWGKLFADDWKSSHPNGAVAPAGGAASAAPGAGGVPGLGVVPPDSVGIPAAGGPVKP
jgi:hypothetical protein